MMNAISRRTFALTGALVLALCTLACTTVRAQDSVEVNGIIKARNGDTMILETTADPKLVVHLTDGTRVAQIQGMLKARSKDMSMAALIPGLPVQVKAFHDTQSQLVATEVKFKGNDLQQAQAIQAGMHETQERTAQNEAELAKQKAALEAQQAQMSEQEKKIAANKAQIAANSARFGMLDDYYIMDEVTVLFPNGVSKLDPKYQPQLKALADKAKTVEGYMIEVKGYASSTGSAAANQAISEKRANGVTNYLIQQCHVSLTRMLAPAAMGETNQVETKGAKPADDEAQNRRVVVRVLQNKAIAGTAPAQ
jgi:outer membrane protein OmpA-like peptidoglycan-associated protein